MNKKMNRKTNFRKTNFSPNTFAILKKYFIKNEIKNKMTKL